MKQQLTMVLALLGTAAQAEFLKTCLEMTETYGFLEDKGPQEIVETSRLEGDSAELSDLPANFLAWARPQSVKICSDEKYVHGIQFTLMMHNTIEEVLTEQYKGGELDNLVSNYDKILAEKPVVELNMVGQPVGKCETLVIDTEDRIAKIVADSDGSRLRHIMIEMVSASQVHFGGYLCDINDQEGDFEKCMGIEDGTSPALHEWSFVGKESIDILGAYGLVAPDADDPTKEHIIQLGFFTNTCPMRNQLHHEKQYKLKEALVDVERFAVHHFMIVFICLAMVVIVTISSYYCLKNRGMIFKESDPAPAAPAGTAVNQESVDVTMQLGQQTTSMGLPDNTVTVPDSSITVGDSGVTIPDSRQ